MAAKDTPQLVAATITAALIAHGKTKPKNIKKAVRAYHACLDELNKPRPTPQQGRKDQTLIDRALQGGDARSSEDT